MIIAIDGNSIGKNIEKYILNEQLDELSVFSQSIFDYLITLKSIIEAHTGIVYMCGGDNILASVDDDELNVIINKITSINPPCDTTFSIGCGGTARLAYLALAYRKSCLESHFAVTFCRIQNGEIFFQEE